MREIAHMTRYSRRSASTGIWRNPRRIAAFDKGLVANKQIRYHDEDNRHIEEDDLRN